MTDFLKSQAFITLLSVLGGVIFLGLVLGLYKYFVKHPPKTKLLAMVDKLTVSAVYELAKTDSDGRTKMHGVIDEVIKNLGIIGVHIPDNISNIIEDIAEKAVADMRNNQSIANNAPALPATPPQAPANLKDDKVAPQDDEDEDGTFDIPVAPEDAPVTETDESGLNKDTAVLSVNGIKPDADGNIVLPIKDLK